METKKCYDCDVVKNIDEFDVFRTESDGKVCRRRMCRECYLKSKDKTDTRTKLKKLRENRSITQDYLSRLTQISEHKIKAFENKQLEPSVDEYKALAKALKVAPEYFGIIEHEPEKPNLRSIYPDILVKGEVSKNICIEGTYKISKPVSKRTKGTFIGKLIQETDNFIVFEDKKGIRECFLKVDFMTGEISKEMII